MEFIIEFYKGLDTINLIIFWGVIIVVILLLIFAILITNKNKRLKQIIISKEHEIEESKNVLAIKNEEIITIKEEKNNELVPKRTETDIDFNKELKENIEQAQPTENTLNETEEKKFIAEEHVIQYKKELYENSDIEKFNNNQEQKEENYSIMKPKKEIIMPTGPYQRNVLREMSLGQTSPIGIIKKDNYTEREINNAKELQESLTDSQNDDNLDINKIDNNNNIHQENTSLSKNIDINHIINEKSKDIDKLTEQINQEKQILKEKESLIRHKKEDSLLDKKTENRNNSDKEKYLNEVSKKLSEAKELDNIERTEYEIRQEEDAIISYEELMQKKDSIKMIDEEEAIISIEELMEKKRQEEKLYNLTDEEENDKFISELKHFRSDL